MKAVVVRDLEFSYNDKEVLKDVNFEIDRGEFLTVIGPNGAGKTTLVKILIGYLKPVRGEVLIFGHNPKENRKKVLEFVGYLPQREHFTDMPILVRDVMKLANRSKSEEELKKLLELVGMEMYWNERFNELSMGQQQRVLIARALINDPKLLILDEPFNGVDLPSQGRIIELLNDLKRRGITVIAVLHNVNPLLHYVDKILLLNRRVVAFGKPEEVLTHENVLEAYGISVQFVICEDGYAHPFYDHG